MTNLNYSPKDILQQEFKTKMRGYDPIEVDEFLDGIIKDYETYNKEILTLQEENDRLNAKIAQLSKSQAISSRNQATPEAPKSQAVTNFDILKRLSNLEKEVFGKKLDQTTPTNGFDSSLNRSAVHFSDDDLEKTRQF